MASQQESVQTRWSYKDSIYSLAITRLTSLGTNSESVSVNCPKNGCKTKLYRKQQLYRHIETAHPEDKLHNRKYSNNAPSTLATAVAEEEEEVTLPNTENVVMSDVEEMMETENDYHEEVPFINTQFNCFIDDYLNDEYLKVCKYFCISLYNMFYFRV